MKDVYRDTVGNNCNMMINMAPDTKGVVHYEQTYRALGDFISLCYPSNVAMYPAHVVDPTISSRHVASLTLDAPMAVDRIILQEEMSEGQCIQAYTVTVEAGGSVVTTMKEKWLGHKRILQLSQVTQGITSVHVEITAQQAECEPHINLIAVNMCQYS